MVYLVCFRKYTVAQKISTVFMWLKEQHESACCSLLKIKFKNNKILKNT